MPPAYQQCMFRWPSVIVNRIIDTHYWKYYIAPTSFCGKYWLWEFPKLYANISSLFTAWYVYVILSYLWILKMSFQALCIICTSIKYEFIFMCNAFTAICKSWTLIFFLGQFWHPVLTSLLHTKFSLNLKLYFFLTEPYLNRFHNPSHFMLFKNIFCYD